MGARNSEGATQIAARPITKKYGANSDPVNQPEAGTKDVKPTKSTATIKQPRNTPKTAPNKRSNQLSPASFMAHRVSLAITPAATTTSRKMMKKPASPPAQAFFT